MIKKSNAVRCHENMFHEVATAGGDCMSLQCAHCLRVFPVCRVCRVAFASIVMHHFRYGKLTECGRFDRVGMWWTAVRPPPPPRPDARRATDPERSLTLSGIE